MRCGLLLIAQGRALNAKWRTHLAGEKVEIGPVDGFSAAPVQFPRTLVVLQKNAQFGTSRVVRRFRKN